MNKKQEREFIFNKTNGKCGYCGEQLSKGWHVDHMFPIRRDKDSISGMMRPQHETLENKLASCPSCNRFKGVFNLEGFRTEISLQIERLNQYSNQYRLAKRFGLIQECNKLIVFYFEMMQK